MEEQIYIQNRGKNNIANSGNIYGDCNAIFKKYFYFKITIMDNPKLEKKINDAIESLCHITKSNTALSEALLKQKDIDLKQAEADIIRAKADENNSLANLNMSKAILKDQEISERLLNLLEGYEKR